jgi:hypothetical protein
MALVAIVFTGFKEGYRTGKIKKDYAKRRFGTLWDGLDVNNLHSLNF